MLNCQKELFSIEEGHHYINCAYMSPLLKSVEKAGIEGLIRKCNPQHISPPHFFNDAIEARGLFAELIQVERDRVALIPSASYGLATAMQNVKLSATGKLITIHDEFPSDVYTLNRISQQYQWELITVKPPDIKNKARKWNEMILEAIVPGTMIVNLSSVQWTDGTIFDLEAIGKRAKEVGALFVVDGTQSVGAKDINVKRCQIDALICAGYKWLLGPYTSGFAYFNEYFDEGKPLEESWLNRKGSDDFRALVQYEPTYHPKAGRYNMGESSNFINLPMLKASLTQILQWTPAAINEYCAKLTEPLINYLNENGFLLEEEAFRSKHLFGFRLPERLNIHALQKKLIQRKVSVSLRGSAVRVSPHVYNDEKDIQALMDSLDEVL